MPREQPRRERRIASKYTPARERTRLQKALDRAILSEFRAVAHECWPDRDAMADSLGISRRHFYRELERLGVQVEDLLAEPQGMTGLS